MAKRVEDSLWFPEKLGRRLVELRRQRGLTQRQVAELMGRAGRGSKTYVCRLEQGWFRSPSLRLLGDYLRACGAGFEDVLDVLHEYTSRPTVPDEQGWAAAQQAVVGLPPRAAGQVLKYDLKAAEARYAAGKLPESPTQRAERARKLARSRRWLSLLHAWVVQVINEHGFDLGGLTNEMVLQGYARKVWGILGRTRQNPEERARLLSEAEEKFLRQGLVRPEVVQVVDRELETFYRQVEEPGPDDAMPDETSGTA
jgi:transcriptional regulator with XRE-family HTH domain